MNPCPTTVPTAVPDTSLFYVAPDGSDANPGTFERPWATINHAAQVLRAGEAVIIRGGRYAITEQIRPRNPGTLDAWITYAAYPGEQVVIDARAVETFAPPVTPPHDGTQGAFQIEGVGYMRIKGLKLVNSHSAGFMVRDSHHVELINNITENTFSCGIALWDTDCDARGCEHNRVIGNTVIKANTWDMILPGYPRGHETPHEAISVAGAAHFEVAYNHVYDCDKEGIDVKEVSRHGAVHHNYVHHLARQGLYVDSWFGPLEDVDVYQNVVHDCRGAGFAISVEGGELAQDIRFHHNLLYNNLGTGIYFSRWGGDGPRRAIRIYNNTVHHNGYGPSRPGETYYWMTGGLYLFSANLQDIDIMDNIFSDNQGFQIGHSDLYSELDPDVETVLRQKDIHIAHNLVCDRNAGVEYPIRVGWSPGMYADVHALAGDHAIEGDPAFADPSSGNFYLRGDSSAIGSGSPARDGTCGDVGAFSFGAEPDFWWKGSFPPRFE